MKTLVILLSALWAACALWYPSPSGQGWRLAALVAWLLFAGLMLCALWWRAGSWVLLAYGLVFAGIAIWWVMLPPSNQRPWANDVARMTTAEIHGRHVTLHNVRHFDWRTETDYTSRWEVRDYDLDRLASVDMLLSYWTGPAIAHTLVSFGFDDGRHVAFSVEIRKEQGEAFSEVGGFFKRFELSVVAADEHDIVRVRTNVRGEEVYLYRVALSPEARRSLFLAYVAEANQLAVRPRFYHTLTANCTTLVWHMMKRIVPGLPLDYRLLLSGYLPDYVHNAGGLDSRYTVSQLREVGRITDRAKATDAGPGEGPVGFSAAIRQGIPELPQ